MIAFQGDVPSIYEGLNLATFALGCFWGPQILFDRVPGVVHTTVGYTQGSTERPPSYNTMAQKGHTEGILVAFDPTKVTYEDLLTTFWNHIDPTVANGQGNDFGTQYRTGIYYHTSEQETSALSSLESIRQEYERPIQTEIRPASVFYPAEAEHQDYLARGGRFGVPQSTKKGSKDPIRCYG